MKPSVGRIVHYTSRATGDPVCRAAVITEVGEFDLSVTVFLPDTSFTDRCIQDEDGREGGTWHWPERTD
jgi:hypothetical protein